MMSGDFRTCVPEECGIEMNKEELEPKKDSKLIRELNMKESTFLEQEEITDCLENGIYVDASRSYVGQYLEHSLAEQVADYTPCILVPETPEYVKDMEKVKDAGVAKSPENISEDGVAEYIAKYPENEQNSEDLKDIDEADYATKTPENMKDIEDVTGTGVDDMKTYACAETYPVVYLDNDTVYLNEEALKRSPEEIEVAINTCNGEHHVNSMFGVSVNDKAVKMHLDLPSDNCRIVDTLRNVDLEMVKEETDEGEIFEVRKTQNTEAVQSQTRMYNNNRSKKSAKVLFQIKKVQSKKSRPKTQKEKFELEKKGKNETFTGKKEEFGLRVSQMKTKNQTKSERQGESQTVVGTQRTVESTEKKKQFKCTGCGKTLPKSCYYRHMKKHAQEDGKPHGPKHICEICGKDYREKAELKYHMMRQHTLERPFKCDTENCGKAFIKAKLLRIHQDSVHRNLRPFKCVKCLKTFNSKPCLNVHMVNLHGGEATKTCPTCGEYFCQQINLDCHVKAHKDPSILRCKICGKSYRLKTSLEKHVRAHKRSFECEVCGEEFSRKSYLLEHQWKHTGTKQFECPVCKKSFSQKGNMTIHKKTQHSENVEMFYCTGCDKGFNMKSNLKVHMRRCKKLTRAKMETDEHDTVGQDVDTVESQEENFRNTDDNL